MSLGGDLDLENITPLGPALSDAAASVSGPVVVDLSGVGFADSSTVNVFLQAYGAIGPRLRFAALSPSSSGSSGSSDSRAPCRCTRRWPRRSRPRCPPPTATAPPDGGGRGARRGASRPHRACRRRQPSSTATATSAGTASTVESSTASRASRTPVS